jgi:hypothetical protein
MVSALKVTTFVGCAAALVEAKWFKGSDSSASSWAPAKQTVGAARLDEVGWTPKPTGSVEPLNIFGKELRKREDLSESSIMISNYMYDVVY